MPCSMSSSRLPMTDSGLVKSTATVAPEATNPSAENPTSSEATSSRSSAAVTALQTSEPIRPAAPRTATLTASADGTGEVLVPEGADHRERHRAGQHVGGDRLAVIERHRVD